MSSDLAPQVRSLSAALAELSADGWRVLHGVAVPGARRATIDHVLVGPSGVFAVNEMPPEGRGGDKRLQQVREATDALRSLTSIVGGDDVHAVLCMLTEAPIDGWRHGVVVGSLSTVAELVTGRRTVLDARQVNDAALELDATTERRAPARKARGGHRLDVPKRGWLRFARP